MSEAVDRFLVELQQSLACRGRRRVRLLAEVREHLADLGGDEEAVRRFGSAADLAISYDVGVARGRVGRALGVTAVGVVATAGSTLVLLHDAQPGAVGSPAVAALFFVSAQVACVALALAMFTWLWIRPPTARLLQVQLRRCVTAVLAAQATLLAAGVALPGHGSPLPLLAGPVLCVLAMLSGLPGWVPVRRRVHLSERLSIGDVAETVRLPRWSVPVLVGAAAFAALLWDALDGGNGGGAWVAALVEAAAATTGYFALGRPLGLRP